MLEKILFENRTYKFVEEQSVDKSSNKFTILVGRNGTGKSRILSAIVNDCFGLKTSDQFMTINNRLKTESKKLTFSSNPEKIIALSTSPFDRFPLMKRSEKIKEYSYLGLRDLPSSNFGLAYLSKIISSLLTAVDENVTQTHELATVLNYLGYSEEIKIRLESKIRRTTVLKLVESENPYETLEDMMSDNNLYFSKKFFLNNIDNNIIPSKVNHLIGLFQKARLLDNNRIIQILIKKGGVETSAADELTINDIVFLLESGIMSVKQVELKRLGSMIPYSIKDASSGEQSVIIGILGLASQIQDNSLVCIDEPEICLHPEWQERYIKIITTTFKNYKNCHFIIATHSPQIIANLESSNCYILSLENRQLKNANTINNNSADFQLANIFQAPGFKNEYLSRIALNTFVKVSRRKLFDVEDEKHLSLLTSLSNVLSNNDPVKSMISALNKMQIEYA